MPARPDLTVVLPPEATALERLVGDYLANCWAGGLSEKTIRFGYGCPLLEVFPPWCAGESVTSVRGLDRRTLDRFSAELQERGGKRGPLSKYSVWTYVKAVNRFLRWAREEGERNMATRTKARTPKLPQQLIEVLSREEIDRIERAADNESDALIVRVLAGTGVWVGQLAWLRASDLIVHDRSYFLRVRGKGGRERLVPVTPALHRRLARYAESVRPVDTTSDRLLLSRRRDRRTGDYTALEINGVQQLVRELGDAPRHQARAPAHLPALRGDLDAPARDGLAAGRADPRPQLAGDDPAGVRAPDAGRHLRSADQTAGADSVIRTDRRGGWRPAADPESDGRRGSAGELEVGGLGRSGRAGKSG